MPRVKRFTETGPLFNEWDQKDIGMIYKCGCGKPGVGWWSASELQGNLIDRCADCLEIDLLDVVVNG